MFFVRIMISASFAVLETIPVSIIVLILINGFIVPFTHKKQIEKAQKECRAIIANLEVYKMPQGVDNDYAWAYDAWCTYVFDYKGKKYKYHRFSAKIPPPEKVTIYFKKNPKKAKESHEFGKIENVVGHVFLPVFILLIIFNIIFLKI